MRILYATIITIALLGTLCAPASAQVAAIGVTERPETARTFAEPLVTVGTATPKETHALAAAVRTYRQSGDIEAVEPFIAFLQRYPQSPWKPSLLAGLAGLYRHVGLLDRALNAATQAWQLTADSTDPAAKAIADGALATRVEIIAALGRVAELADLLDLVRARPLTGHAAETISGARSSLWRMRHDPAGSFRCGPLALQRVSEALHPGSDTDPRILQYPSTTQGTSLAELADLARTTGLDLRPVKREPGSPIPVPAVVHWKDGHFAALVAIQGNHYHVKDLTFGDDRWMSGRAIDEESSGYLLARLADDHPQSWHAVSQPEAAEIRGRGAAANTNPGATTAGDPKKPDCANSDEAGMPRYSFHLAPVSLNITDTPVKYTPPRGQPMRFGITYNSREDFQPATFTFTNLGSRWNFNWTSYIEDDDPNFGGGTIRVAELGGGSYLLPEATVGFGFPAYGPNAYGGHDVVLRQQQSGTQTTIGFLRTYPDGSQQIYGLSDNAATMTKWFLTSIVDKTGNTITLGYDAHLRLVTITDAIGQQTTLSYGLAGDIYKLTTVTDPFGRTASFQYSAGELQSVTDAMGLTSSFAYGSTAAMTPTAPLCEGPDDFFPLPVPGDFINAMTTPYGTTTFVMGESQPCVGSDVGNVRWLQAADPLGNQERIEYQHEAQNVPETTTEPLPQPVSTQTFFLNQNMAYRNTYYWNQIAMQQYSDADPDRYIKASVTYHWNRDLTGGFAATSSSLDFVQIQGQRRIWMGYPGEPTDGFQGSLNTPTVVAQVLDNGQVQLYQSHADPFGRTTFVIDPTGRELTYIYAPSTSDVTVIQDQNLNGGGGAGFSDFGEHFASYTYNSLHEPLTYTDYAGQTTTYTYDLVGNLTSVHRPDGFTVNYTYDAQSFLTHLAIAGTAYQETFTHDAANRLASWTSTEGYTLNFSYDNLDRLTTITFPDGTTEQAVYGRRDIMAMQDRLQRVTTFAYDGADHLVSSTDPAGRTTTYSWCGCGTLTQVTDAQGHSTSWTLDGLGRVLARAVNGVTTALFDYDSAGRLVRRTDALNQVTSYAYTIDNMIAGISYQNTVHPTPNVEFLYDINYPRLVTRSDSFGATIYTYNPAGAPGAGQIQSITAPAPQHTLTFQYDVAGRRISQALDGVPQTVTFDAEDRLATITSPLGTISQTYSGSSGRAATLTYPNGQGAAYSYLGATGDFRPSQVSWGSTANNLSQFNYTYEAGNQQILGLTWHDINHPSGAFFSFSYDGAKQLLSRAQTSDPSAQPVTVLHADSFAYDASGNRTSEVIDSTLSTTTFDGANQLISIDRGLSPHVRALLDQERARTQSAMNPNATPVTASGKENGHEN